jgi:hypothetical protein
MLTGSSTIKSASPLLNNKESISTYFVVTFEGKLILDYKMRLNKTYDRSLLILKV